MTRTETMVSAIRDWAASLPAGAAVFEAAENPGDEYGSRLVARFSPARPKCCALELAIVEAAEPQTGIFLDTWGRLAKNHGLSVSRPAERAANYHALFLEPRLLPMDHVVAICRAVSMGSVEVSAGVFRGRIYCTRGRLRPPGPAVAMNGVGGPLWPARVLRYTGAADVKTIQYQPWL